MKKLLLLFFLAAGIPSIGQSLEIVTADTHVMGNAFTSADVAAYITIKNVSTSPKIVRVKRIDLNYNALTDSNAICWAGTCFLPHFSVSPTTDTLAPGETGEAFSGHVYPDRDGVPESGSIRYVFYDDLNPDDSLSTSVTYEVTADFSLYERIDATNLKVFPNPASDRISVEYDLPAANTSFELINMVGQRVYERLVEDRKGEFKLDISKLKRGVYFYILRSNGEAVVTKKLVVQ